MRRLFAIAFVLALVSATAPTASQTPLIVVHITAGAGLASVYLIKTEMYFGASGWVAAKPGPPPELTFGLGAWKEGDKARAVVYAMLVDKRAPDGRTQTPISTFLIAPGQSLEVKEAFAWGVRGLVVSASLER